MVLKVKANRKAKNNKKSMTEAFRSLRAVNSFLFQFMFINPR